MNWIRKSLKRSALAWLLICVAVLSVLLGLRASGVLQRWEVSVYDLFVGWRVDPTLTDERIVVCGMTEDDLIKYGHPLDDAKLALLLEKLVAANPCVIGMDLYRDLKEPRSGEFYPKLEDVLRKNDRIIAIDRIGKIKPPPALLNKPERVAPNNIPRDYKIDDVYRRACLFFEEGLPTPRPSFALALSLKYLAARNVEVQMVESGSGGPLLKLGKATIPRLTKDAGSYVGVDLRDYEMLADYRIPFGFPLLSFGDVLENPPLREDLEGKIILVATNLDSVKDSNKSPVEANHRGVLQHASVINQLISLGLNGGTPMGWWPEPVEIGWIALITFLGGLLGWFFGSPWRLAPQLLLGFALVGLAGWIEFQRQVWIPIAAPWLGFFLASTFVTSFVAYANSVNLGAMKSIFSQHVSSSVVEELWRERDNFMQGGQIRAQRLTATVFFTDLKNFSTIAENMDPATLLQWMNEFMSVMVPKVEAHGGMVNKFIGDAIMALFGVPMARSSEEEHDRDAVSAVRCALTMGAELRRLNLDWKGRGLPEAAMRVGINTGPLVSGSFGSSERMEFTVLGDTVNTGARLEGAGKEIPEEKSNPECTILISESTYNRLGGRFNALLIGPMSLKGKGEEITVYSVLSEFEKRAS